MKQKLFLFTVSFPYGVEEKTFIIPELFYLVKQFDVTIVSSALQDEISDTENISGLDKRIKLYTIPRPSGYLQKIHAVLTGIFPIIKKRLFWNEIYLAKKEGNFSLSCIKEILSFYVRAVTFYKNFKKVFSKQDTENAVFYTFWCTPVTMSLIMHRSEFLPRIIFTRMHGGDLYHERAASGRQPFRNYLNEYIDGIVFVAYEAKLYYEKNFPHCRREILYFCPLGVFKRGISPINEELPFRLVSCSHTISLKRIDLIIQALAEVPESMVIHWVHYGDGEQFNEIKRLAENLLNPKKNVSFEFMGRVPNEQILSFYEKTPVSCFITTSSTEGLPVSIQEALACGIPIIGTDVGGIGTTINGNGVLLSAIPRKGDVLAAIKKMYSLSEAEKQEYQQHSLKIWEEKFDAEKNNRRFCDVIRRMGIEENGTV